VSLNYADLPLRHRRHLGKRDLEQKRVNTVRPWWDHVELRTALTAVLQKHASVLVHVAIHTFCQDAATRERLTITGLYDPYATHRNLNELDQFDSVLPGPQGQMQTRRERISLVACLSVECKNPSIRQTSMRAKQDELLRDDTDAIVGDNDDTDEPQHLAIGSQDAENRDGADDLPDMIENEVQDGEPLVVNVI